MEFLKVTHLTSVHKRYDSRIFHKQCRSLARRGYHTTLIVADGKGNEKVEGISIVDVGKPANRFDRIVNTAKKICKSAAGTRPAIFHLHDPELLPLVMQLKKAGGKVVFDAHEDVPVQILNKPYLWRSARWVASKVVSRYERRVCGRIDGVIAATPYLFDKFKCINEVAIDIRNYPLLAEMAPSSLAWANRKQNVCYVGGLTKTRGIQEIVSALEWTKSQARLSLGGEFTESDFERIVKRELGWGKVDELGFLTRSAVSQVLSESVAGLVTLHPIPNYVEALPVKMFEYMCAGIPVIASDIPLWRDIINSANCGICVDPLSPRAIAEAIDYVVQHPSKAQEMGRNGRLAIEQHYNWSVEERKLFEFYERLGT